MTGLALSCVLASAATVTTPVLAQTVPSVRAALPRGQQLLVFFTAIRDAPERMLLSTIDLSGDWAAWSASEPVEIMRPEAAYECANLPIAPSEVGDVAVPVRQIRDPHVFQDQGRTFLFYSTCGEQGIAAAELTLP